mmetsp:Transcript_2456/g.4585  ORF Transcript_2456/g.4585 Transcript_2456/m.4585 type:complete len:1229 (+) Transcript_2456:47-3733(+)
MSLTAINNGNGIVDSIANITTETAAAAEYESDSRTNSSMEQDKMTNDEMMITMERGDNHANVNANDHVHDHGATVCRSTELLSKIQKKRRVPCYGRPVQRQHQHQQEDDQKEKGHCEKSSHDDDDVDNDHNGHDDGHVSDEAQEALSWSLPGEEQLEEEMEELSLKFSQESSFTNTADTMVDDVNHAASQSQTAVDTSSSSSRRSSSSSSSKNESIDDQDITSAVDTLFVEADIHTFTVKDIVSSVEDLFQTRLDKAKRKIIKARLIELVNQVQEEQEQEQEEETQHDFDSDSDSDASESSIPPPKTMTRKRKSAKKRSYKDNAVSSTPMQRMTRPKRASAKKRIPSHVKIHHESLRKRQLAEAQVLAEEMQEKVQQKISEEDKKRAEAIAKKFETDTEELRLKREKERKELIELLEQKRMKILSYNVDEPQQGDDVKGNNDCSGGMYGHGDVALEENDSNHDCEIDGSSDNESDGSSDDEESDSEAELEIVGMDSTKDPKPLISDDVKSSSMPVGVKPLQRPQSPHRRSSPTSVVASVFSSNLTTAINRTLSSRQKMMHNSRKMLRNKLKAKQIEHGNMWLAREHGYEKVEDHIRDCNLEETERLKEIIEMEKKRLNKLKTENDGVEDGNSLSPQELDVDHMERRRLKLDVMPEPEYDEEDEEMAMAREVEHQNDESMDDDESYVFDTTQRTQDVENDADDCIATNDSIADESVMNVRDEAKDEASDSAPIQNSKVVENMATGTKTFDSSDNMNLNDEENSKGATEETVRTHIHQSHDHELKDGDALESLDKSDTETKSKPRNTLWKEVLKKEAELFKKMKKRRGGFVDNEAEEEEEEEGVAGLEDFGFTVQSKKKSDDDDEEEHADVQDDDFENIVDDVSDDEGDEEAGEAARKAMALEEEKLRHKEILRTMREGYDGRRGGIAAGAGTARGNLAFDQLVAADNKKDAKKLGLANEDELDSDDDDDKPDTTGDDEIEDENLLLDSMLKDRFLNRTNVPAEEFSDSDDEEESVQNDGNDDEPEDDEDVEQELLAKRFARRARMNRLIEIYGANEEFSQGRLLDQSEELKQELRSIRNVQIGARRQTSFASSATSTGDSSSQILDNAISSLNGSNLGESESSLFASASSLSFSNSRSRNATKRKSSFITMCRQSSKRKMARPTGVTLGHVVFAADSQSSNISKSAILPSIKSSTSILGEKRSAGNSSATRSSLWSKVASNGFKSKRMS